MSRLDDRIEIFGVVGTFALLIYVLVFLPLWGLGVFEWKLFYSSARLVDEQVELCVADRNTEAELLILRYDAQEDFGSNEAEIFRGMIADEIQKELEISEEGFKALSLTEQNRLIENWDSRPFIWEKIPEINFTEESKERERNMREFEIEARMNAASFFAKIVAEEIADNEKRKEINKRIIEDNKQARKEDAVWNGLEQEKRVEVCMPEIEKRTRELNFFSRVDRYREKFSEDLATIQVGK
ncbi:hypothetical protein N9M79_02955 [Alphaproteobacteria bacterium]|nr:hypothetical protein [Alphaproteobacteria bacterium]